MKLARKVTPGVNDLQTLHPDIAAEYASLNKLQVHEANPGGYRMVMWVCREDSRHIWYQSPVKRTTRGAGCPYCANRTVLPGCNDLQTLYPEIASQIIGENPRMILAGSGNYYYWQCPDNEDHTWKTRVVERTKSGTRCPHCYGNKSTSTKPPKLIHQESELDPQEIVKYILEISPEESIETGVHEASIYLPDRNLAIDYNGISDTNKDPKADRRKRDRITEKGIDFLAIWEDQWLHRKEVVKSHLRSRLGLVTEKVMARKCSIEPVTSSEANQFFEDNHIQGGCPLSEAFALKYGGKIVACVGLTKSKDSYVLSRYATSVSVPGGHSRLVSHVESVLDYDRLVTFADLGYSSGELYRKTGWAFDKEIPPDYSYKVGTKRVHKFNYRRSRFARDPNLVYDENMTEAQMAEANNLLRVYDYGKIRFTKKNTKGKIK